MTTRRTFIPGFRNDSQDTTALQRGDNSQSPMVGTGAIITPRRRGANKPKPPAPNLSTVTFEREIQDCLEIMAHEQHRAIANLIEMIVIKYARASTYFIGGGEKTKTVENE